MVSAKRKFLSITWFASYPVAPRLIDSRSRLEPVKYPIETPIEEVLLSHYKVAIVGVGPAGYFTAQALQNAQTDDLTFSIDMFERLPTMWGLVRSGVAPDHPKIRSVSKVF